MRDLFAIAKFLASYYLSNVHRLVGLYCGCFSYCNECIIKATKNKMMMTIKMTMINNIDKEGLCHGKGPPNGIYYYATAP